MPLNGTIFHSIPHGKQTDQETPVSSAIVETAVITLRAGVSEADLIAASDTFQREFLNGRKGFMRRELLKLDGGGGYLDLLRWADNEAADAVNHEAGELPVCQAFFSLMENGPSQPDRRR
jgi:hypothetical protein